MKKIILVLIGFFPFVLGFLMNKWLLQNLDGVLPYKLIGIIFLASWLLVGFTSSKFGDSLLKSAIIVNLPAFIILLLIMFQEIILAQYWPNDIGELTQLYYLPLLNISSSIVRLFVAFTPWPITVWFTSFIAFSLMFAFYYLSSYVRSVRDAQYSR